jgi:hypothetical protein
VLEEELDDGGDLGMTLRVFVDECRWNANVRLQELGPCRGARGGGAFHSDDQGGTADGAIHFSGLKTFISAMPSKDDSNVPNQTLLSV